MEEKTVQGGTTLVKSVFWKLLERSSVQIITLITQIILARIIAPDKFGSLSIIVVFYNLADLIIQKGFGSALIRKENLRQDDINSAFFISAIMSVIIFALIFIFAPFIGSFYKDSSIVSPLRLLAVNLLISPVYCICNSLLIREMKFKLIFARGLCASVISGIIGIILAYCGWELWALVVQMVVHQIILTAVMQIGIKYKLSFSFSKEAFKEVFSFGKNVLVTELLLTAIESIRSLVIGKVYTKADLAYYDRGQVYPATLMRAIYDTLFSTLLPYLTKFQNSKEALKKKYVEITYISLAIIVPMFLGLAAVSDEVIHILLTDKWAFAVPYMQIFCVYQAIFPYQITAKATLYAAGDSKKVLRIEILHSVVSLLFMIISMSFGVIYVALSLIATRAVSDILYTAATGKKLGKTSILKKTWQPIVSAAAMCAAIHFLNFLPFNLYAKLIIKVIAGVGIYVLCMAVVDTAFIKKMQGLAQGYLGRKNR